MTNNISPEVGEVAGTEVACTLMYVQECNRAYIAIYPAAF